MNVPSKSKRHSQVLEITNENVYADWCPGRGSNPHAFRQPLLRRPCLPFHHPGEWHRRAPTRLMQ